jgi:hypothetical protein
MGWLEELRSQGKSLTLSKKVGKTPQSTHVRDVIIKVIDDSISYFNDPQYRLASGRRKGKEPSLIYSISGQDAIISLTYARSTLLLDGTHDVLTIPKADLLDVLNALRNGVSNGEFDGQLEAIKTKRSEQAKKKRRSPSA